MIGRIERFARKLIALFILLFLSPMACDGSEKMVGTNDPYCFESVSKLSGIESELLQAFSFVESRHKKDAVNFNNNGSVDFGHMQINSIWVAEIGKTYIELDDPCFCTQIGAYILSGCIEKHGYNANAISCYNTGRPLNKLNGKIKKIAENYVNKVLSRYQHIKLGDKY